MGNKFLIGWKEVHAYIKLNHCPGCEYKDNCPVMYSDDQEIPSEFIPGHYMRPVCTLFKKQKRRKEDNEKIGKDDVIEGQLGLF